MATWYLILAGTPVAVSRDGSDFRPQTLRRQLQFPGPVVTTDEQMIFEDGGRQVLVDRTSVVISRYDGSYGTVQWGA